MSNVNIQLFFVFNRTILKELFFYDSDRLGTFFLKTIFFKVKKMKFFFFLID